MSAAQAAAHVLRTRIGRARKARLYDELVKALAGCVDVLVRADVEVVGAHAQCTDEEWDAALAAAQAVLTKTEE